MDSAVQQSGIAPARTPDEPILDRLQRLEEWQRMEINRRTEWEESIQSRVHRIEQAIGMDRPMPVGR